MSGEAGPRNRIFIDTTILLYLIGADTRKAEIAEALLQSDEDDRIISTQVIGEFINVARRKAALGWDDIRDIVDHFREICDVHPVTSDIQDSAIEIAARFKFSWYDSVILASAAEAGAQKLMSEDFQHGQTIGDLRIENPFAAP